MKIPRMLRLLAVWLASLAASSLAQNFTAQARRSLTEHNNYRAKHNTTAMELDPELNSLATQCAMFYAKKGVIDHSCTAKGSAGENLFMWAGSLSNADLPTPADLAALAVKKYYEEISFYDFNKPDWYPQAGHFSQVVWKSSTKLGLGMGTTFSQNQFVAVIVNLYSPAGNVRSMFVDNVLPPQ